MKRRSLEGREVFLENLQRRVVEEGLSPGQVVKALRVELLGVDQATFARIGKVSVRTLRDVEAGRGNPSLKTLDGLLRPFGFQMGVVKRRRPA